MMDYSSGKMLRNRCCPGGLKTRPYMGAVQIPGRHKARPVHSKLHSPLTFPRFADILTVRKR